LLFSSNPCLLEAYTAAAAHGVLSRNSRPAARLLGHGRGMMLGVAMYRPTRDTNIGGMLRTAHVFGADAFCLVGAKYQRRASDTTNAAKHIALFEYESWSMFHEQWSGTTALIAVENAAGAISASMYRHPEDAMYILGNEKDGLPNHVLETCDTVIAIDTPNPWPLNVTTAGSIVIAYRYAAAASLHQFSAS
jgi:tRNA G18 (ribose-2'-O)-methylase SpoU